MPFDLPRGVVVPVTSIEIILDAAPHPFETASGDAIERNWRSEVAANPALFDGRIVLLSELVYRDGVLSGRCHETRYATLLYWRLDRDGASAEHAFAHAALVSSDNALVAIRMGLHTANAGKVYFAAGSFEPMDFRDGLVDIDFNMRREVGEETGLDIATATSDEGYHLYSHANGSVIFRRYRMAETAAALAKRIEAHVAAEAEPEILGPVVIRDAEDLPEGIVPHMEAIVRWHFSCEVDA